MRELVFLRYIGWRSSATRDVSAIFDDARWSYGPYKTEREADVAFARAAAYATLRWILRLFGIKIAPPRSRRQ